MTPRISEADFQRTVTDALTLYRWRWTHFRPANTGRGWRTPLSGSPGFPDIVAVRGKNILFIELKSEKGRISQEQADWLYELDADWKWYYEKKMQRGGPVVACVWRPSDWDQVMEVLK